MIITVITIASWVLEILFVSNTTKQLNDVQLPNDKPYRDPTNTTLLCLFVPFYSCFWCYKMGQKIDVLLERKGSNERVSTLYLVLGLFVTAVALIMMYLKLKELNIETVEVPKFNTNTNNTVQSQSIISAADELLKYKELLDAGILTQEEFDQKKKELLNL